MATRGHKPSGFSNGHTADIGVGRQNRTEQLHQQDDLLRDRIREDQDEAILERTHIIKNLQGHVRMLEKQLERAIGLNPALKDDIGRMGAQATQPKEVDDNLNQLAALTQNSTLLESYERIMEQYEDELQKKTSLIQDFERQQQQLQNENNALSEQLYKAKTQGLRSGTDPENTQGLANGVGDLFAEKLSEQDQMVEVLRRNHDAMMLKYETYRQRNEELEAEIFEKKKIYSQIKSANDSLQTEVYEHRRNATDLSQKNEILESKLRNAEQGNKESTEAATSLRSGKTQLEGQLKVMNEQLEMVQKSHEELARKKHGEQEVLSKEVNTLSVRERDARNRLTLLERENSEVKDQARQNAQELEIRSKENDHLVSLLEDTEQKIQLYEEKEKQIFTLAQESKKRIEDANLERDRVLLKEQQYLQRIGRLEDQLKKEATERQERHERVIESLRAKHKTLNQQKEDDLADLQRKLSDETERAERVRMERDSIRDQHNKGQDSWQTFREESRSKYENFSKQLNQQEALSEEKLRGLKHDSELLREENEVLRNERETRMIEQHELEVKLDNYMRDYERYFDDNKRLRELTNQLRDEKEGALAELNRQKVIFHGRLNELSDESNVKVAHLENMVLETKERYKAHEEQAYSVMVQQEKITEKWKDEHRATVSYYDRTVKGLQIENRHLSDKVIEFKSQLRLVRQENAAQASKQRTTSSDKRK